MTITGSSSHERIHRAPFGQASLAIGRSLASNQESSFAQQAKPLWDLLARHGIPAGQAAIDALLARIPMLPEKPRRRLERFLIKVDVEPISDNVMRTMVAVLESVLPSLGFTEQVIRTIAEQEASIWRKKSLHPAFLALAREPAEAFCLVPDAGGLTSLPAVWGERDPELLSLVTKDINVAIDLAARGDRWLNRWEGNRRPTGLWHWSWKDSDGISVLNGGVCFVQFLFVSYTAAGALSSIRVSRSAYSGTPPGIILSHSGCSWSFIERSWSPSDEHEVTIHPGIDLSQPFRPQLRPVLR